MDVKRARPKLTHGFNQLYPAPTMPFRSLVLSEFTFAPDPRRVYERRRYNEERELTWLPFPALQRRELFAGVSRACGRPVSFGKQEISSVHISSSNSHAYEAKAGSNLCRACLLYSR